MSEGLSVDEQSAFELLYKIQSVVKGASFTATRPASVRANSSGAISSAEGPTYRFVFPGVLTVESPNVVMVLALVNFACGEFLEVKHD